MFLQHKKLSRSLCIFKLKIVILFLRGDFVCFYWEMAFDFLEECCGNSYMTEKKIDNPV